MESCLLRGPGVVPQHFFSPRIGNRTFCASCDIAEGNLDPCHFALTPPPLDSELPSITLCSGWAAYELARRASEE